MTGEDLGLEPSTVEQAKFEYPPLGKVFIKGLDKNDQEEGLFKRLKNIGNAWNKINNSEYFTPRSRIDSKHDEDEDDDEDENEKTERDLYQGSIEGMKGLKLPGEIESKDEKSPIYLKNNLNKIKNSFSDICGKYQRFFMNIANEEKKYYKMLSSKVPVINFLVNMVLRMSI